MTIVCFSFGPARSREMDLLTVVGPFHPEVLCDSMNLPKDA